MFGRADVRQITNVWTNEDELRLLDSKSSEELIADTLLSWHIGLIGCTLRAGFSNLKAKKKCREDGEINPQDSRWISNNIKDLS